MSQIASRPRPPDPRLAREPDRRGRRHARSRARSGRAAVPSGASTGAVRGGRAARRRRRRTAARASARPSRTSNGEIAAALAGRRRRRPARARRGAHRARRDAEQGRGSARTRSSACSLAAAQAAAADAGVPLWRWLGGEEAHVLPVPMMNVVNGGAHAQNSLDFQEFMVVPVGAATLLRGAADRRRGLPRAEGRCCTSAGSRPRSATRAASRPTSPSSEAAIEAILEAVDAGRARGDRVAIALDPAATEIWRDGAYGLAGEGQDARRRDELIDYWAALCRPLPDRLDRGPLAEDDWDGWRALTERLGDRVQLVGDDLFVTNVERLAARDRGRRRERDPRQGQPDRHAHRDARRDRAGPLGRLRGRHVAPLGRDRGHDDRRPRRGDRTRARSRPARRRAPTASRSTTSCCGSRRSSATAAVVSRAGRRFRARLAESPRYRDAVALARRPGARRSSARSARPRPRQEMVDELVAAGMDARAAQLLARHARGARASARALVRGEPGARAGGRSR